MKPQPLMEHLEQGAVTYLRAALVLGLIIKESGVLIFPQQLMHTITNISSMLLMQMC